MQKLKANNASEMSRLLQPALWGNCPFEQTGLVLGDTGRQVFFEIWSADPARWTDGDLRLIAQVGALTERLEQVRAEMAKMSVLIETSQGQSVNPLIKLEQSLISSVQTNIRDLHIRSKDRPKGFSPQSAVKTAMARTMPADEEDDISLI